MFENFFDVLASVLNFFYTLVPSFGFAIMALTVLVMTLITPLTVKSTKSMLQMQRLQPEMKRLQTKYKDDREKLNEELMKFYRENQINPLGGCLPIIAQMPVFIIMYRLLHGLTDRNGGLGSGLGHIAGQSSMGEALTPWVYLDQNFSPEHLNSNTEMYRALAKTNTMNFLGMDLALSPAQVLKSGFVAVLPFLVLLLIMLATGIYQNRQLQARNKSGNVNPQQQAIMKIMPFFLPVFSFQFPAGLALYWCTQNFCRIGTNSYITRSVYRKEHAGDAIETSATEKDSGGARGAKGGPSRTGGKTDGKAVTAGATKSRNGAGATDNQKREAKAGAVQEDRGPGKSVKSQAAHRKSSGRPSGGGSGGGGRPTGRRSGQPRRGSKPEKG